MLNGGLVLPLAALPSGGLHLHAQAQGQSRGQETHALETVVPLNTTQCPAGHTRTRFRIVPILICLFSCRESFYTFITGKKK